MAATSRPAQSSSGTRGSAVWMMMAGRRKVAGAVGAAERAMCASVASGPWRLG